MDAENYKNRYRAVLEFANGAIFNVAELDAWATLNKVPVAFQKLLSSDGLRRDPHHHFVSYEILSNTIASNLVPEGMNPNDAKLQLKAAHDNVEPPNPVSRLRDLIMMRYDRLLLCAVYDGELDLYDTLTYTKIDVTAGRLRYEAHPETYLPTATAAQIQEQVTLWERRQPARLFAGPGFSEEALKLTTLSKYLDFDTWTPEAAALLVCGLQAPIIDGQLCTEIPKGAMGLDNCFFMGSQDPFHEAKRVLGIWRSQVNPPDRVRPLDFVRWCRARGFDTAWLQSIEEDALNTDGEDMKAAGRPEFLEQGVTPDAPELLAIGLAREQWDRMTASQRQSALQAIADTEASSEQVARQADERRALGRYTLNEAAQAIAATGERFEALLEKLCGTAQRGALPMHAPGERARYEYTNGKLVRPFYEEAYWNDLNTWLDKYEPRITFRFATPVAAMNLNTTSGETVDAKPSPDKFTLFWLNRKIDEDASFAEQAAVVLQRMNEQKPKVVHDTTTPASAASALVNEWLVNRDLPCYMRGRPVDDFAALTLEPGSCNLSDTMDILECSIHLHRDDVVRLLEREGMAVPHFLRQENPPDGPARHRADASQPGSVNVAPVASDVAETPAAEAGGSSAAAAAPLRVTSHSLASRGDLLTPVIRRVVTATGSHDSNVVFTRLREMAIEEEAPLNGVDDDGALLWTDASGSKKKLTRRALAERLRSLSKRGKAG
ncbi:hypothetical protein WL77_20855 [Burkholderia ubonensis]|uniref:hypothetical protein n=1 Tax=Burkholderia ubonensis TaxID=101571 RepID=UPI0007565B7A|nr:hypothetical protein [Burkholderia ubonensis]KWE64855.1 hypothetical protein WL77_20855 [Burkholderia ubonensis]KWE79824.1 hypothetical protein WL79_04375 [Burkholderia ubonensis]